ncbi:MAG TPA: hypothetical protein V6C91_10140 [Coleofasciculaceae cyanobacterium]
MPTSPKTPANSGHDLQPFLEPIGELSTPAGFAAPCSIQSDRQKDERAAVLKTAEQVLNDPLLLRRLSDRVYELMLEDLRNQRERSRNYGNHFKR